MYSWYPPKAMVAGQDTDFFFFSATTRSNIKLFSCRWCPSSVSRGATGATNCCTIYPSLESSHHRKNTTIIITTMFIPALTRRSDRMGRGWAEWGEAADTPGPNSSLVASGRRPRVLSRFFTFKKLICVLGKRLLDFPIFFYWKEEKFDLGSVSAAASGTRCTPIDMK